MIHKDKYGMMSDMFDHVCDINGMIPEMEETPDEFIWEDGREFTPDEWYELVTEAIRLCERYSSHHEYNEWKRDRQHLASRQWNDCDDMFDHDDYIFD